MTLAALSEIWKYIVIREGHICFHSFIIQYTNTTGDTWVCSPERWKEILLRNSLVSVTKRIFFLQFLFQTFIVINKNKQLFRFSSTNALGIFSPTSTLRSNAIRIITHPFYAIFMVLVILAFCVVNAMVQPAPFDL